MYLNKKCLIKIEEALQYVPEIVPPRQDPRQDPRRDPRRDPRQPKQNSLSHKIDKGFDAAVGTIGGAILGTHIGDMVNDDQIARDAVGAGAIAGGVGFYKNPGKAAMVMLPAMLATGIADNEMSHVGNIN